MSFLDDLLRTLTGGGQQGKPQNRPAPAAPQQRPQPQIARGAQPQPQIARGAMTRDNMITNNMVQDGQLPAWHAENTPQLRPYQPKMPIYVNPQEQITSIGGRFGDFGGTIGMDHGVPFGSLNNRGQSIGQFGPQGPDEYKRWR